MNRNYTCDFPWNACVDAERLAKKTNETFELQFNKYSAGPGNDCLLLVVTPKSDARDLYAEFLERASTAAGEWRRLEQRKARQEAAQSMERADLRKRYAERYCIEMPEPVDFGNMTGFSHGQG
jgi:hypothetical protein